MMIRHFFCRWILDAQWIDHSAEGWDVSSCNTVLRGLRDGIVLYRTSSFHSTGIHRTMLTLY